MSIHSKFLKFTKLSAGTGAILLSASVVAQAACAVAVGNGTASSQDRAEKLAKRDAIRQVGQRPRNASFSKPICFVSDNFETGVSEYGCEVEMSYCSTPRVVEPKPVVHKRKSRHYRGHHQRHHRGHYTFFKRFNSYQHRRTVTQQCLTFNATATHKTGPLSRALARKSLRKSLKANTGVGLKSPHVRVSKDECYATTPGIVHCAISAKYCG